MILKELELIHDVLFNFRHSESCAELMLDSDTDKAINFIKKEIKLKTLDPRKTDVSGNSMDSD